VQQDNEPFAFPALGVVKLYVAHLRVAVAHGRI